MCAQARTEYLRLTTMEEPACGLHRIAMLEIAAALRLLDDPTPDAATAVHDCRKGIKRLRALARLARRRDPAGAQTIDELLRRAGRALSGQRDAEVVVETARAVEPSHVTPALAAALGSVFRTPAGGDAATAATALAAACERFEDVFDPERQWRSDELLDAIVDEFEALQRRARVYLTTSAEKDAHEVRKTLQRCLAQLRVVALVTHANLDERIEQLNDLSQRLGDHHDLAVLRATLKSVPRSSLSKSDRKKLRRSAKSRQRHIDAEIAAGVGAISDAALDTLRADLTGRPSFQPDSALPGGDSGCGD